MLCQLSIRARHLVLLAAGLAVVGCGDDVKSNLTNVKVSGTVTRGGKPVDPGKDGLLRVTFIKADDPATTYPADTDEGKGKYTLTGIPAGRYKVAVEATDRSGRDALQGRYAPGKTTIEKDVADSGEQVINIDL